MNIKSWVELKSILHPSSNFQGSWPSSSYKRFSCAYVTAHMESEGDSYSKEHRMEQCDLG